MIKQHFNGVNYDAFRLTAGSAEDIGQIQFCIPQNVRLSDDKYTPEICVISGVFSFGKAFGKLCSGKGRFTEIKNVFEVSMSDFIPYAVSCSN